MSIRSSLNSHYWKFPSKIVWIHASWVKSGRGRRGRVEGLMSLMPPRLKCAFNAQWDVIWIVWTEKVISVCFVTILWPSMPFVSFMFGHFKSSRHTKHTSQPLQCHPPDRSPPWRKVCWISDTNMRTLQTASQNSKLKLVIANCPIRT